MSFDQQLQQMKTGKGFIAALDQSGGSTPKALALYGVEENEYNGEAEMFDLIHAMRTRIITSPSFSGDRVIGAILFEMTMDREIAGIGTAEYLWTKKQVVPFLKVDKGLADEENGVQLMKPMPGLDELLKRGKGLGIFGTKMRSVVKSANAAGIKAIVEQQFEVGLQIVNAGLVPILEPEVDIHAPDKSEAENILKDELMKGLGQLNADQHVMFKLTLPNADNHYRECIEHPNMVRVVALSGGYERDDPNDRPSRNHGMIASFSRALSEGLSSKQSDNEFNATLDQSVGSIYEASIT